MDQLGVEQVDHRQLVLGEEDDVIGGGAWGLAGYQIDDPLNPGLLDQRRRLDGDQPFRRVGLDESPVERVSPLVTRIIDIPYRWRLFDDVDDLRVGFCDHPAFPFELGLVPCLAAVEEVEAAHAALAV